MRFCIFMSKPFTIKDKANTKGGQQRYNKNKKLQLNFTLCTIFCFYASRIPSQDLCPSPGERRCYGWPTAHAPAGERPEDSCRLDSYYSEEEAWLVSESPLGFNCSVFAIVRSHIGSSQFGSGLSPRRAVKSSFVSCPLP